MATIPTTAPQEIIPTLKWCFREALRDELNYPVQIELKDVMTLEGEEDIKVQYYYYPSLDKCFIEYDVGINLRHIVNNFNNFIKRIEIYIDQWFKYNTNIYPEIMFNDSNDIKPISGAMSELTPFTIGYLKCINGLYEFLYDKQFVMNNSRAYIPTLDNPPSKKIIDYFNAVKEIRDRYKQTVLSEDDKEEYFAKYNLIYETYKDNPIVLKQKLNELYDEYGIRTELNKLIPDMYAEYVQVYTDFFGKDLPTEELEMTKFFLHAKLK